MSTYSDPFFFVPSIPDTLAHAKSSAVATIASTLDHGRRGKKLSTAGQL